MKKGGIFIDWREVVLNNVFHLVGAMRLDKAFQGSARLVLRISFSTYSFTDYFKGFEKTEAIKQIFGEKTEEVLHNLRVEFIPLVGYMGVNGLNGHLIVNPNYLRNGDRLDVHLDVIHELVHIRQFIEGRELFDNNYSYVQRPTEVEAYRYAVEEARRLGQSDERIYDYLETPWMSIEDHRQLARTLNIKCRNNPSN
ncbi:hypothetical protein MUP77_07600 [Candidatus Bathyarchaeota archaeon]|nr:hypothetical protein [Candidatus Bathyarchaeota archaeon]